MAIYFLGLSFTLSSGLRRRHLQAGACVTTCQSSALVTAEYVLVSGTGIYIKELIKLWLKCALLSLYEERPIDECRSEESGGALQDFIDSAAGGLTDYDNALDACLSCAGAPTVAPLRFRA